MKSLLPPFLERHISDKMGDRAFVSDSAMMKAGIYQFFLQETRAFLEKLSKYRVLVTEFFQDTSNSALYESEPQPCALVLEDCARRP